MTGSKKQRQLPTTITQSPENGIDLAVAIEIRSVESIDPIADRISTRRAKSAVAVPKGDSDRGKVSTRNHVSFLIVIKVPDPGEALANSIKDSGSKSPVPISKQNRGLSSTHQQIGHVIAIQIRGSDSFCCSCSGIGDWRLESAVAIPENDANFA